MGDTVGVGVGRGVAVGVGLGWGVCVGSGVLAATTRVCRWGSAVGAAVSGAWVGSAVGMLSDYMAWAVSLGPQAPIRRHSRASRTALQRFRFTV